MLDRIARDGVQVYGDAVALLRTARGLGVRTAVVTASENCSAVLAAARIANLFDAGVDGLEIARLGLRGKPAPDSFVEAARRLGVSVACTAVFEDAIAGVQAARAGGFGLVIGVDRDRRGAALRESGAKAVVSSLEQIELVPDVVSNREEIDIVIEPGAAQKWPRDEVRVRDEQRGATRDVPNGRLAALVAHEALRVVCHGYLRHAGHPIQPVSQAVSMCRSAASREHRRSRAAR